MKEPVSSGEAEAEEEEEEEEDKKIVPVWTALPCPVEVPPREASRRAIWRPPW